MNKSEIARRLDVSKSYITMLEQGIRMPSRKMQRKINKLLTEGSLPDTFLTHGVQVVVGSNPTTPTSKNSAPIPCVFCPFRLLHHSDIGAIMLSNQQQEIDIACVICP
jgi:DNA-binding XRE family transcriptional regulator